MPSRNGSSSSPGHRRWPLAPVSSPMRHSLLPRPPPAERRRWRSRGRPPSAPRKTRAEHMAHQGLPIVAIVGRPNVGKSTLFNRVVGSRTAIVEDRARTTRDRLYGDAEWNDRRFVIVDTGGLERSPDDPIEAKVQEQARLAIAE